MLESSAGASSLEPTIEVLVEQDSEAEPPSAKRRRVVDRGSRVIHCSPGRAMRLSILTLLPVIAQSMELTPVAYAPSPHTAVVSTFMVMITALWYGVGTSAALSLVSAVPSLVEKFVGGAETVLEEVVEALRVLVRYTSWWLTCILAILAMKTCLLYTSPSPRDP